jgi:hypothetical protein
MQLQRNRLIAASSPAADHVELKLNSMGASMPMHK